MRWFLMLMALWFAPVSFSSDDTEAEEGPTVSVVERGTCPGGTCPKRPRPRPKR
jgi:hypothetical protein